MSEKPHIVKKIAKQNKNFSYNYIQNWKRMVAFYTVGIVFLYVIFFQEIQKFITKESLFLIVLSIGVAFLYYGIAHRNKKIRDTSKHYSDFRSFHYAYLRTKYIEILLQQFFIIALLVLTNNNFVLFLFGFVLIHLFNFLNRGFRVSMFFLFCAIPASVIFYVLYTSSTHIQFGVAYSIHILFYLMAGTFAVFQNIKKPVDVI